MMTEPNSCQGPERLSITWPEFLAADGCERTWDVVIVGSGYGGSMAAHAIAMSTAREGKRVLLLERGREFQPGDFPRTFGELPRELRVTRGHSGSSASVNGHEGLFDLRLGEDVVALVANGLGGGSLINAGVMLSPDPAAVDRTSLQDADDAPLAHTGCLAGHLRRLEAQHQFTRASRLLMAQVQDGGRWVANDASRLPSMPGRVQALHRLANRSAQAVLAPVTVAFNGTPNPPGTSFKSCNLCGDCMTGCNVGAKISLDRNLLRRAKNEMGAQLTIVTGATVSSLRPEGESHDDPAGAVGTWVLRVQHTAPALQGREVGDASPSGGKSADPVGLRRVKARHVVLAAGTLGSPEILLRSRTDRVMFSNTLGESFSGNGDNIAAVHRMAAPVNGCADERVPVDQRGVGPTISASVPLQPKAPKEREASQPAPRPFLLQDFAVPGPMKRLFDEIVTTGWALAGVNQLDGTTHQPKDADPMAVDATAMAHTLLVGSIGHDSAGGSLRLAVPVRPHDEPPPMGTLRIHWPEARKDRELDAAHDCLLDLVQKAPGLTPARRPTLVANPVWRMLPQGMDELIGGERGPVLTVHPLGGCRMGHDSRQGVVDTCGRVFDARQCDPAAVHRNLVVLDGSVIGSSLGVNPALTISAIALAAMDRLLVEWGFDPPAAQPGLPPEESGLPLTRLDDAVAASARSSPSDAKQSPGPMAPAMPSRTEVSVSERLWGAVALDGNQDSHVLELTLAFQPASVSDLIGPTRMPMKLVEADSRLRLYALAAWNEHHLRAASDATRREFVCYEAPLTGCMRFLHREPSSPLRRVLRGGWAWLRNRGLRDLWQQCRDPVPKGASRPAMGGVIGRGLTLASHNGQIRLFDYHLKLGQPLGGSGLEANRWPAGTTIKGRKRLGYARRASPWAQLMEMELTQLPGLGKGSAPILRLDLRHLARIGKPLLHVERQHDHAEALAELMSFGLYLARVLVSTHLWSFRKPDRVLQQRDPQRLPGPLPGLPPPQVTTLVVDRRRAHHDEAAEPVSIRLTRYARPGGTPLAMLHGYSASGTTFTHPSLGDDGAAAFFWHQGRDVWVIDLRTSCGLPSATLPWSMEQVALIDIPAALLHIRNVTGQRVDVLAHCIGAAMLGMAVLTEPGAVRADEIQLGVDTWLPGEQLGTLAAFNGPGRGGPHPTVRRIVLSQKGPVMRYTDANVLRTFVLQHVRRWLMGDTFSFQPSRDPGVAEQLLDRLLSSLPYDREDFDVENPGWPCARTEWVATRHRLDVLFGRVFTAANLRPQTLEAIDDLFGPIHLDTVAQTIHFTRFDAITNQRGRGEFVTLGRLRRLWAGIPTMVLQSADNGLADPHTHVLLSQLLRDAGVPLHEHPVQARTGHQDLLIGIRSRQVFQSVETFLSEDTAAAGATIAPAQAPLLPDLDLSICSAPWIGPRLVAPGDGAPQLRVAALSRPDQGNGRLWLLPVALQPGLPGECVCTLLPGAVEQDPLPPGVRVEESSNLFWRFASPVGRLQGGPADAQLGWLAVFVHRLGDTTARRRQNASRACPPTAGLTAAEPGADEPWVLEDLPGAAECWSGPRPAREPMAAYGRAPWVTCTGPTPSDLPTGVREAVSAWLQACDPGSVQASFVAADSVARARRLSEPAVNGHSLHFALASCQYPTGLFDRLPAAASLKRLAAQPEVSFALMVGDQIYADASAGLVDPTRRDELYDLPHHRALQQDGMRAVLRRMPAFMLLDDHELYDNWQPLPQALPAAARRVRLQARRIERSREQGLKAFLRHQRMERPRKDDLHEAIADKRFMAGGHAFCLLDTRTDRYRDAPSAPRDNSWIISPWRMARLKAWLRQHRDVVKFVATPAMLLPRQADVVGRPGNASRADAWDGFPDTLGDLLGFIGTERITKTVFLSGDAHHSLYAEAWLGPDRVKVVSVHSSALYAPYPFANGRPTDLRMQECGDELGPAVCSQATSAPAGDGFAVLHVDDADTAPALSIRFVRGADGSKHTVKVDLL